MENKVRCEFISVWDGGIRIESPASFDPETGTVSEVRAAPIPWQLLEQLDVLDRQLVRVDDTEYELRDNDDGTYTVLRTYGVFFERNGYMNVQASSAMEAREIAEREARYDDISWDDDWSVTNVQLEE